MPMLERPEGDIHYEVCDIVPPWVEARETIFFLHGLAIDSDIWVTWLPTLADRYRIVRMDLLSAGSVSDGGVFGLFDGRAAAPG